jgi:ribonuclease HI
MFYPQALHIFTDGSCYKNPGGLSGCAAIVRYPDDSRAEEQIVDEGVAESSIGRMELMASNRVLEWLRKNGAIVRVTRVQIITDSQYVFESVNRAAGWRSNGWRALSGRPVENQDLWKRFLSLRSKLRILVTFHYENEWMMRVRMQGLRGLNYHRAA